MNTYSHHGPQGPNRTLHARGVTNTSGTAIVTSSLSTVPLTLHTSRQ